MLLGRVHGYTISRMSAEKETTVKKPTQLCKLIDLDALPRAEARVEIARDVIAAVKAGILMAGYIYMHLDRDDGPLDLRARLALVERCKVCAVGAVFVATVARADKFQLHVNRHHSPVGRSDMVVRLSEFFSEIELNRLESAYESEAQIFGVRPPLGDRDEDRRARLLWLMRMIVDTKGAPFA